VRRAYERGFWDLLGVFLSGPKGKPKAPWMKGKIKYIPLNERF
jgi:hypothetical protein